jgi:pyruvate dehydrogenase E1 component alpha subunit
LLPRGPVEIRQKVESLSILDQDGKVDAALEPKIDETDLKRLYRAMLLARRLDERLLLLQRQGRIGTFGPAMGQEAASLGPAYLLQEKDWFVPSFREPAAMLWRGWPISKIILWWAGNEIGATVPDGINDLPICVPVATQTLHAAGIAWGCKLKGDGAVTVCFVGDGGTSEGDFHEALNFAGVHNLPVVFIIQNNHWAISLPRVKQSRSETLAQKAIAYGFNGLQADGNDILAMIAASQEAIDHARSGGGPTLIEAITYRLGVHTTADDPKKYRSDEEVACWKPRDPLIRFLKYLTKRGLLDDKAVEMLEAEITAQIQDAVDEAETYEPDMFDAFRHTFAEMPPSLREQMQEFQDFLSSQTDEDGPGPRAKRQMADA